ncbi:MAG: hypothetical protein ACP5K1_07320 [Candidatus Bathyarchaeia archaeon]
MYEETLTSYDGRSAHIKSRVRVSSPSKYCTFKIINFPNHNILLEGLSFSLLKYIDLKLIEKPLVLVGLSGDRVDSHNLDLNEEYEAIKRIVEGARRFEAEIRWESPLIAFVGVSKSRFPFEGALLQIYNAMKPLFSTELIRKSEAWVTIEFPSRPEYYRVLDWALFEIAEWLGFRPNINVKTCLDEDLRCVFIGLFLNVQDFNKFITTMEGGDALYNLEFYELEEDCSKNIDLSISLLEEV